MLEIKYSVIEITQESNKGGRTLTLAMQGATVTLR